MAVLLDGFEGDADLDVVRERVGEFFTFGTSALLRELLELAASAFLACGASSGDPLVFDELEERYLPEWPVRGNAAHQKRRYALHAAVVLAAGVEPGDTSWWRADNLWSYAFDAVVACACRVGTSPVACGDDLHRVGRRRLILLLRDERSWCCVDGLPTHTTVSGGTAMSALTGVLARTRNDDLFTNPQAHIPARA